MQYSLKLSSTTQNPAYSGVFNGKFKSAFDRKPNQIPPLSIRVEPDLHAIGFKLKDIVQSFISLIIFSHFYHSIHKYSHHIKELK